MSLCRLTAHRPSNYFTVNREKITVENAYAAALYRRLWILHQNREKFTANQENRLIVRIDNELENDGTSMITTVLFALIV